LSISVTPFIINSEPQPYGFAFILVVLFWLALTVQAWRALRAVRALPRLKTMAAFG
jgi:hypothetical protein